MPFICLNNFRFNSLTCDSCNQHVEYNNFVQNSTHLLQRISLQYLGSTLSRIQPTMTPIQETTQAYIFVLNQQFHEVLNTFLLIYTSVRICQGITLEVVKLTSKSSNFGLENTPKGLRSILDKLPFPYSLVPFSAGLLPAVVRHQTGTTCLGWARPELGRAQPPGCCREEQGKERREEEGRKEERRGGNQSGVGSRSGFLMKRRIYRAFIVVFERGRRR